MKKRNLKSLTLNKQSISVINSIAAKGGSTLNITTRCPTDSLDPGCFTYAPFGEECIAPPNP